MRKQDDPETHSTEENIETANEAHDDVQKEKRQAPENEDWDLTKRDKKAPNDDS